MTIDEMQSKVWDIYRNRRDAYGMVVQKDWDGGDSAYRTALTAILANMAMEFQLGYRITWDLIIQCYLGNGQFRRHPDANEWYSNPNNFSRDQAAKVILCLLVGGEHRIVWHWLWAMAKRGFFHQNTRHNDGKDQTKWKLPDIISPGEISNLIRGLNLVPLVPLLWILDLRFVVDLKARKKKPWDYDSLMAVDLCYSRMIYTTPIVKYVIKKYRETDYKECILNNYADANNGIQPLGELYVAVCEKVFYIGE